MHRASCRRSSQGPSASALFGIPRAVQGDVQIRTFGLEAGACLEYMQAVALRRSVGAGCRRYGITGRLPLPYHYRIMPSDDFRHPNLQGSSYGSPGARSEECRICPGSLCYRRFAKLFGVVLSARGRPPLGWGSFRGVRRAKGSRFRIENKDKKFEGKGVDSVLTV